MYCQNCGTWNASDHRFCRCGVALSIHCGSCGSPNHPDASFCVSCRGTFPEATEEQKRATVLFADITDSTGLSLNTAPQAHDIGGQEIDPGQVKGIYTPVVRIMRAAVARYGGVVDPRPRGDGVMATFGAPQAIEDHAVRACLAALSLQDGVRRLNEEQRQSGRPLAYQVRVGLSSGQVLTSDTQTDGPTGEAPIIASRMEDLAQPGTILLAESTWRLVRGHVRTVPLGAQTVKGRREAIEVYQLEAVEARTRFNARQNQGLSQFVGREAERDLLARAMQRAAAGDGQVVTITGGAGVGKSRLIHHFLRLGTTKGAAILETCAEPYDRDSVYLPVANLLRSQLSVVPSDPSSAIQAKLEAALSEKRHLLPAACTLLDLPLSREFSEWREFDPAQRRRRISDVVRELVLEAPRPSTLVLVIEDLQWLGADARAIVDELIAQVRHRAVLLVLSMRDQTEAQGAHCQILELQPLEPLRAHDLLRHLVGDAPTMEPLRTLVLRRADERPTPLFLEETVSSLVEQGVLQGTPGQYALVGDLAVVERKIPHKVEEVLAARIDRLTRDQKRVLDAASVVGMAAPLELLGKITGQDVGPLLRILSELQTADLMYESMTYGQPEFIFKHTLTREVAATRIPLDRRQQMHAQVVNAIESLYEGRREEWIDRLADHACRAGLWAKAHGYCADACRRAIERSANRQAVSFFEKGLEALAALPDEIEQWRAEIDLRLMGLTALLPLGEQELVAEQLHEAKELALSLNDAHCLAKVELQSTLFLWETGSYKAALESGATALSLAASHGLDRIHQAARVHVGNVHHALGEFQKARDLHQSVLDELIAAGLEKRRLSWSAYPAAVTRAFCADCCINLGDFERAAAMLRAGKALTDDIRHPYSRTLIETTAGRYHLALGEPAAAMAILEEAERRCREDEVHTMVPSVVSVLGTALARSRRTDEALRLLERALDDRIYLKAGNYNFYYLLMAIGEARWLGGHLDQALDAVGQAEQVARRNGERAHLAQSLYWLGVIHAHRTPSVAEHFYLEARDLAEQSFMRPLVADCWFGLADVDRRLGRSEGAGKLEEALTRYQVLGLGNRARQVTR